MNQYSVAKKTQAESLQEAVARGAERPLVETMSITAQQLEEIERKMGILHALLFGPEPMEDHGRQPNEHNIKSLAYSAFESSIALDRMLDETYNRIANPTEY